MDPRPNPRRPACPAGPLAPKTRTPTYRTARWQLRAGRLQRTAGQRQLLALAPAKPRWQRHRLLCPGAGIILPRRHAPNYPHLILQPHPGRRSLTTGTRLKIGLRPGYDAIVAHCSPYDGNADQPSEPGQISPASTLPAAVR
jgi:hypothetical protein